MVYQTTSFPVKPGFDKTYPHNDMTSENVNQAAERPILPTDAEAQQIAEDLWRYENLRDEDVLMFNVWELIMGDNNQMPSTSSGETTTPSQAAALGGQVFSTSTEEVGVFSTSTQTASVQSLVGFRPVLTTYSGTNTATRLPTMPAPFNTPPVPPNSPQKLRMRPPISFTQPLSYQTTQDSASIGLPPEGSRIPSDDFSDNTDGSNAILDLTEVYDVDPPPDQRYILPHTTPTSQPIGIMTVSAGLTWKNWTMISVGFAAILFSTIDMDTLPEDIDSREYSDDIQGKTKKMLDDIYKSGSQVITDIKNLTPQDLGEIKMMGTIVGSLMITWGFCEHQIVNLMGSASFVGLGSLAVFDPRGFTSLPKIAPGWGKAVLMTPGIMSFVLAYWKSPVMSRWLRNKKGWPVVPYSDVMDGLQPNTYKDWDMNVLEKIATYADQGLVAYQGAQVLTGNYGRYMTLTLIHLAMIRPYTYGLYLSGPTKTDILNWSVGKLATEAQKPYFIRAQNAFINDLRNYVLTSKTFKAIKQRAQNTIGMIAIVGIVAAVYLYS